MIPLILLGVGAIWLVVLSGTPHFDNLFGCTPTPESVRDWFEKYVEGTALVLEWGPTTAGGLAWRAGWPEHVIIIGGPEGWLYANANDFQWRNVWRWADDFCLNAPPTPLEEQ